MTEETKQLLLCYAEGAEKLYYEMSAREVVLQYFGRPGWREAPQQTLQDGALRELNHKKISATLR